MKRLKYALVESAWCWLMAGFTVLIFVPSFVAVSVFGLKLQDMWMTILPSLILMVPVLSVQRHLGFSFEQPNTPRGNQVLKAVGVMLLILVLWTLALLSQGERWAEQHIILLLWSPLPLFPISLFFGFLLVGPPKTKELPEALNSIEVQ